MNRRVLGLVLAGIAVPVVLVLVAAGSTESSPSGGITVTGTGTATSVPDRASFSFGVTTQAATASQALARNGDAMEKVIAALKAHGIATADLQTQSVSLSPRTSEQGDIVGYTASDSVSATGSIDRAGEVIDAAVGAGATDVSGPSFTRADQDALYRQALKAAVADAKAKAQVLAAAAGVSLGGVTAIVESGQEPVPIPFGRTAAPSTPIEPGTQQTQATVTVTFALA
jgi:uncharacterized protein YggE